MLVRGFLSIKARIIAATMKILGLETIEDSPENSAALPQHLNSRSKSCDKKEYLTNLAGKVVDQFVLKCHKVEELLKNNRMLRRNRRKGSWE